MRAFVESLRRLYIDGKITAEKVNSFLAEGKITAQEAEYILGEQADE